jgi:hypothetical protein
MLHNLAIWLADTRASAFIANSSWVWPAAEIVHFIGLSLLLGIAGLFDLRLIGFFRGLPVGRLHDLMPWAIAGFALNLATGLLFVVGMPAQYVDNPAFHFKVAFIGMAGLNAVVFERFLSRRVLDTGPGESAPVAARVIGAASLASWLLVLYCGRVLAFIGPGGAF